MMPPRAIPRLSSPELKLIQAIARTKPFPEKKSDLDKLTSFLSWDFNLRNVITDTFPNHIIEGAD